jgi:hypothetical protein
MSAPSFHAAQTQSQPQLPGYPAGAGAEGAGPTAQRSASGSVLGSRSSRDRDMSDHSKTGAKHALPTPYADNSKMVRYLLYLLLGG